MKKLTLLIAMTAMILSVGCKSSRKTAAAEEPAPKLGAQVTWVLVKIQGEAVKYADGQPRVTLVVDPEGLMLSGSDGCNRYFGPYEEPEPGHIKVGDINATKKGCPEELRKLPVRYMPLLKGADAYRLSRDKLELLREGLVVLTYEPQVNE